VIFSGTMKGAMTPVASSRVPCGSAAIIGRESRSKIARMKGDSAMNTIKTAAAARTSRCRNSIRCERNPDSSGCCAIEAGLCYR